MNTILLPPRLPAEWETHKATHLAWPSNHQDWPGKFTAARWAFVEMVRHIAASETVYLIVRNESQKRNAQRMLTAASVDLARIMFQIYPLDRGWMRDISPCYVKNSDNKTMAVQFSFNGWAKYDNYHQDATWATFAPTGLQLPVMEALHDNRRIVLEGGAIDANGQGALLTTEECLLDPYIQIRNPGFTRSTYESCFQQYLGINKVIWLRKGIVGDDTHGHVDDICRFVTPHTVVACRESNARDANYAPLEENLERLQDVYLAHTGKLTVVPLPMPAPLYFRGLRLPASYANFYVANNLVLMPTFNDEKDRIALGILGELFPDRIVAGIHAVDLVWGFGTLHCLSHEEPA